MTTHYFEFDFNLKGSPKHATCYVYYLKGSIEMPYKYPMYRVAINYHKEVPDVFVFYEIGGNAKRFFGYPLPEFSEDIGNSIIDCLESFDYRRKKFQIISK